MRKIYLLRHAQADANFSIGDKDRPLTPYGKEQALEAGIFLKNHEIDHILCSSAKRTQETMVGLQEAGVQFGKVRILDQLYNAPADILHEEIETVNGTILMIAHNPGIHQLAFQMASQSSGGGEDQLINQLINQLAMGYPPATLSIFEDGKMSDLILFG